MTVDLGGGVAMEFVWVESLKMWFGKYQVTNAEMKRFSPKHVSGSSFYARFRTEIKAGAKVDVFDKDRQPATQVTWNAAKAYCGWLTERARKEGKIGGGLAFRLPYDWEWSVAVGLDEPRKGSPMEKDGKILGEFPWGTQWPPPAGAGNYAGHEPAQDLDKLLKPITMHHWRMKGYTDGYATAFAGGQFRAEQARTLRPGQPHP